MMTFGEKLKLLRTEKRLVPKQVAPEIGVSHQSYCSYENDLVTPSLDRCGKICRFYGIEPSDLFADVFL